MSMHDPNSATGEDYDLQDHEYSYMSNMHGDEDVMNEVPETKENETFEDGMTMESYSYEANASATTGGEEYHHNPMPDGAMADYNAFLKQMEEEKEGAPPAQGGYDSGVNENDSNSNGEMEDDVDVDEDIPPPQYSINIEDTSHLAAKFVETMKVWSDKLVQAMTTHEKATAEYHKEYARIQRLEQAEAQRLQGLESAVDDATNGFPNISSLMSGGGGGNRVM